MDDFSGVKFDVVFDFAGVGLTTAAAAKAVKAGGKVVLVGLSKKEAALDAHSFVALGVRLVGCVGSSTEEVKEAMQRSPWTLMFRSLTAYLLRLRTPDVTGSGSKFGRRTSQIEGVIIEIPECRLDTQRLIMPFNSSMPFIDF
ncbi:hypothetical protein CSHISOI_07095 [Colletotrichum shisoi]|uniref:Alcohol dehydrogenase-like C-terminal domain-containing protein n=1 Tax=Colletotrichum shisoi TaxID=2078593 RepID=A0A5Q4BP17_9PEZI|nr:hypothetical protein CSHISOI_07095 [Colletotrichum shisoi]